MSPPSGENEHDKTLGWLNTGETSSGKNGVFKMFPHFIQFNFAYTEVENTK